MPRLPPSLCRQARKLDALLPALLPVCRDLRSAENELRWLKDHANKARGLHGPTVRDAYIRRLVARRARGEPLQYILGSEYFGDLELKCSPGVLIPRQETAASISYLAQSLFKSRSVSPVNLRVLDLCSGSGCIPLLFHHEFYAQPRNEHCKLHMVGADLSLKALKLARQNQKTQIDVQREGLTSHSVELDSLNTLRFLHADVLRPEDGDPNDPNSPLGIVDALRQLHGPSSTPTYDVLISNPPYISTKAFHTTTSRSVRIFEPKLALVPDSPSSSSSSSSSSAASTPNDGDVFYPRLLEIADQLQTKIILFEVADLDQAERVANLIAKQGTWEKIEIWRDEPSAASSSDLDHIVLDNGSYVSIRGAGNGRSVLACRDGAATWMQ